jgi:hypothetical protein
MMVAHSFQGSSVRRLHRIPIASFAACLMLALVTAGAAHAQKSGLAFWEPPAPAAALLEHSPRNDPGRYAALRQAFIDFHCTGSLMEEQAAGAHGDKNLVCTLPGQTPGAVLITARYDGHADAGFQPTWVDAYLLPLLYHALQAQPRRHSFVFAALHGEDGEAAFFSHLHTSGQPQPSAMIVLDGLGYGPPLWYTAVPPKLSADPNNPWGVNGTLGGVAAAVCRATKIPAPAPLNPQLYLNDGAFFTAQNWRGKRQQSTLFRSAGNIPELLIYADRPLDPERQTDITLADAHKDLDYTAWVLCFVDLKLDPPPAPAAPTAAAPTPTAPATPAAAPPQ